MTTPAWMSHAACLGHDPELWWPDARTDTRITAALDICAQCPVRAECANYARQHRINDGIWGGLIRIRNRKPTNHQRQPCGTMAAYRRHMRNGETPCQSCTDANHTYMQRYHQTDAAQQKLTADEVRAIRAEADLGHAPKILAQRYGISAAQIHKIIRRDAWAGI